MARRKWVQVIGKDGKPSLVEVDPKTYQVRRARDAGGGVVVHEDTIDGTWNPVDGEVYDSRSRMVKNNRAKGCYEMGNDCLSPSEQQAKRDKQISFNAQKFEGAFQRAYQQLTGKSWV